ncbi:carboxymuconolactone decarboxylase family protein [Octadecabacter sp. R77987]|uniref:carboxymuconolactone decarboxylase family protein n=1 Tax=Octadecabacter sp. R77987 TaxID=3093874 RepID=UPI003672B13D
MDWKAELATTNANLDAVRAAHPDATKAFGGMHAGTMRPGALGMKEKELIALSIGIAKQCGDCIGFHVKAAIKAGATREEVVEAVGVCMMMGGGPSFMYGAKALEAFDQLSV